MTVTSAARSPDAPGEAASLELTGLRRRFGSLIALDGLYGRSILRTCTRVRLRQVVGRQRNS